MEADENKLSERIAEVSASNRAKLKKSNRNDIILFSVLSGAQLVFAVLAIVNGRVGDAILAFVFILWIAIVLVLNLHINHQRFSLDMMFALRKLEKAEMDALLDDIEAQVKKQIEGKKKAASKAAKATA